ncbi:hypothetical protein Syun_003736 [Stephania yunnanensis]|uniref:Uncharacterized protein n=1 Tax=Stephania yunnanensis TaxID=152371 RepID=A0AAP0Q1W5_9MAGN
MYIKIHRWKSTFFLPTREQRRRPGSNDRPWSSGGRLRPGDEVTTTNHDQRVGEMHGEEARCRTRMMQRTTTREMNREERRGPGKRRTREEDDDQGRGRPATTTTKWRRDDERK